MADFSALKTAIQTYIKQNGNEEITGEILQEILLSVVTTLGDSAINDLVTALGNEVTARQNADATLQNNIDGEATTRGNADTALQTAINDEARIRANADGTLQGAINGITAMIENGYVYAGIATPSTTPATGKVFYLALTAGTYTNFGSTEVSQGINILKYNGSAWSLDAFIGIDDTPTPNSPKLVKSGGAFESVMANGSAFDISAHFASGGTLATYADLSAALNALNTLSASYKRGGMSIKFVQSSDNKYVQYRLMADSFSTTVNDWQGVDEMPTELSNNLTESGGVHQVLTQLEQETFNDDLILFNFLTNGQAYGNVINGTTVQGYYWQGDKALHTNQYMKYIRYSVPTNKNLVFSGVALRDWADNIAVVTYLDSSENVISQEYIKTGVWTATNIILHIPSNAAYFDITTTYNDTVVVREINYSALSGTIDSFLKQKLTPHFAAIFGVASDNTIALSPKTLLSPIATVDDTYINSNGTTGSSTSFKVKKYSVVEKENYAFDGTFSSGIDLPYIVWFDENGNYISTDYRRGDATNKLNELVIAPVGAAFAYQNVQNSYSSQTKFYSLSSRVNVPTEVARTRGVLPSGDLNDVATNGTWILTDSNTYQNAPSGIGFLRVTLGQLNQWAIQEFFPFSGGTLYKRRGQIGTTNTWEAWQQISGSVTNNYEFNSYEQTLSVNASPSITTDTNNYLASTNDNTDRTADILTMLQTTGVCHLGPGIFYIDGLIMPDQTSIIGSGPKTQVVLADGENKFAIKMGDFCTVRDFSLFGLLSDWITPTSTVGTRHGILWQGNYTQAQSSSGQPELGTITNLHIRSFSGGGITCYDTGVGTWNCIEVSDCHIWNCGAGINIPYYSEFHKFTNVKCIRNYYGCINNGGNNVFVNCDFSSNIGIGLLMDNSQDQSPNNTHGSCIGCLFHHTGNNDGIGIKILNCQHGYIFSGGHIGYSSVIIENSKGMVFNGFNFDSHCDLTITGGSTILIANGMFDAQHSTITINNNNDVHFANCYDFSTGTLVEP